LQSVAKFWSASKHLAQLLHYQLAWARFEWMDRLRVTKRGGRGLLVTTDDSFPPASERQIKESYSIEKT
jgi:hypothetical protein